MVRHRPVLARLAAAAFAAALPPCAHAQDVQLHTLPLRSLSLSETERTLDWRGATAKSAFDLPPNLDAQNLRLVITADPGDVPPAPHGRIEVRLNGSEPAILRPEPYPFTAQVDFPARFLRPGRNEAVIAFVSPEGDCPNPADGAWVLNIAASQAELTTRPASPETLGELDALLRSHFVSPTRVAIVAPDLSPDDRAAFEAWTSIAVGRRAPRAPRFVQAEARADLVVRFAPDDAAEARFALGRGPTLEVHAPDAAAAVALLRDFARAAPAPEFSAPDFSADWAPEPHTAEFVLDRRPDALALRLTPSVAGPDARLAVALNGRPLPDAAVTGARAIVVPLPADLLVPGRNRIALAPETAPAADAELCAPAGAAPPFGISAMRVDRAGDGATEPDLFGFAGGDFGASAQLVLPAGNPAMRAAQLRLLAEIARRSARVPEIESVSETLPGAGDVVLIAPRAALPRDLLAAAPERFIAALRRDAPRPPLRLGSPAVAAEPLLAAASGAAARFADADGRGFTIVAEADGADFALSLDRLIDRNMLAVFDGRVMRWTGDGADMQDRGPWRAPALTRVAPPTRLEAERTLLFLGAVGGLTLGWSMARSQARVRPARRPNL